MKSHNYNWGMMVETICYYLKKIGYCVIVSIYEVEIKYVSDSKLSAHPILNRTNGLGLSLPLTPFPISFTFMCTPARLLSSSSALGLRLGDSS